MCEMQLIILQRLTKTILEFVWLIKPHTKIECEVHYLAFKFINKKNWMFGWEETSGFDLKKEKS